MKTYIDADLCKVCGGMCCKKTGCLYLPQDFERMSYNYLLEKLNEGNISITAQLCFEAHDHDKIYWYPLLTLRVRNKNRGIIDLVSYKSGCSIHTEKGCPLDVTKRPSMALTLIPKPDLKCYQTISDKKVLKIWMNYQDVLSSLVTHFTHKSVKEVIEEDIDNLEALFIAKDVCSAVFDDETAELKETIEIYKNSEYNGAYVRKPNKKIKKRH